MRDRKPTTPAAEPQSAPLDKQASRQRIQAAIDHLVAGQATEADHSVIRDRPFIYCATGDQCCQIIGAGAGIPTDVFAVAALTLRIRWIQRQSGRRTFPLRWSREPMPPLVPPFEEEGGQK
jgi:hypothetical protein